MEQVRERSGRPFVPARHYFLFACVCGLGCLLDLASKHWVFAWRGMPGEQEIWWLWPHFIGIETSLNTGALFGMGHNLVLWFAGFSAIAFVAILIWFGPGAAGESRAMTLVLAAISAGILGNLYDRLGIWSLSSEGTDTIHAVRDWIRFSYYDHVWPNFNLADSYLVCSACWLVWQSFRAPQAAHLAPSTPALPQSPPGSTSLPTAEPQQRTDR